MKNQDQVNVYDAEHNAGYDNHATPLTKYTFRGLGRRIGRVWAGCEIMCKWLDVVEIDGRVIVGVRPTCSVDELAESGEKIYDVTGNLGCPTEAEVKKAMRTPGRKTKAMRGITLEFARQ